MEILKIRICQLTLLSGIRSLLLLGESTLFVVHLVAVTARGFWACTGLITYLSIRVFSTSNIGVDQKQSDCSHLKNA